MTLVYNRDDLVARYVAEGLGVQISKPYYAIGSTKDGLALNGGVVLNRWNGFDFEIHLYGPGCITRGNLRAIYQYVFVTARALRLTAVTRRSNKTMRSLLPRLGFKEEGISQRYFGRGRANDGMRYVLFPENALKWMI